VDIKYFYNIKIYQYFTISDPRRVDLLYIYELLILTMKVRYLSTYNADEGKVKS
jgi:hypothetical protein